MSAYLASRFLLTLLLVPLIGTQLLAKGGNPRSEDRYDPQHIESLPPEVRDAISHKCGEPRALHPFAHYTDNLQTIVLHYEHFYCSTGAAFCGPSGCLHQIYGSSRGHFRLLKSYYAPEGSGE